MKNYATRLPLIAVTLIVLMLSGCKTKQKTVDIKHRNAITAAEIVSNTIASQPSFSTMNISKMTMAISYGQYAFTFRGSIRVAQDSLVSISIQPLLGIEMYRLEFRPEGFAVYDKMNRRYSQNSYNYLYLKSGINVSFDAVEALFSHHIFTPQSVEPKVLANAFDIQNLADTTQLVGKQSVASFRQRFDISPLNRIALTGLDNSQQDVLSITYGKLKKFDGIQFPETIALATSLFPTPVNATLYLEKITYNEPILTAPVNLSRYTKTSFTDIISFKK